MQEMETRQPEHKEVAFCEKVAERFLEIWSSSPWPIAVQPQLDLRLEEQGLLRYELIYMPELEPLVELMINLASDYTRNAQSELQAQAELINWRRTNHV